MKAETTTTDKLRQAIVEKQGRPFAAADLPKVPGLYAILSKLADRGEILAVGSRPGPLNRVSALFVEVKIKTPKPKAGHGEEPENPWAQVYPDMFELPRFEEKGRTHHALEDR